MRERPVTYCASCYAPMGAGWQPAAHSPVRHGRCGCVPCMDDWAELTQDEKAAELAALDSRPHH